MVSDRKKTAQDGVSHGTKSNQRGKAMKKLITCALQEAGLRPDASKTLKGFCDQSSSGMFSGANVAGGYKGTFAIRPVVCKQGVFFGPVRPHFLMAADCWQQPNQRLRTLALSFKTQQGKGTLDNALLWHLWNLLCYCPVPSVLLLDGPAYVGSRRNKDLCAWIVECASKQKKKTGVIRNIFFGLTPFQTWLHAGMPWEFNDQLSFAQE